MDTTSFCQADDVFRQGDIEHRGDYHAPRLLETDLVVHKIVQRSDGLRKHAFGTMQILGDAAPYEVAGVWMFRGDSEKPMLDANPDAEYYTWTKLDHTNPEHRARVNDYWCAYETVDGKPIYDTKTFK